MRALDIYCRPVVAFTEHESTRVWDAINATDLCAPIRGEF